MLRVGIVGCGLIGQKRAQVLSKNQLVAVSDASRERATQLAQRHPGCVIHETWQELVRSPNVDLVIVSTTNDVLAPITHEAVRQGKHVLVEKPAARNAAELAPVAQTARQTGAIVKVGFNHRLHPALRKARGLVEDGAIGPLLFIRGRYGHGGRIGYDREWRADPKIAGGGELLDQGVHLIDLSRWFLGDFTQVDGHISTYFWNMPVEDNGFLNLRTAGGQTAWLHVSCTEWKNLFSMEIFGRDGKLQIDGLGGSYGVERLSYYRMLPQMGPPETTIWEFPGADLSWKEEFEEVSACIAEGRQPDGNLEDALAALTIIGRIYDLSRSATLGGSRPLGVSASAPSNAKVGACSS